MLGFLLLTAGLALVVRVAHVLAMTHSPLFSHPIMDMALHDGWARRLAGGEWLGRQAFFRAPLYPYLLGLVYGVAGPSPLLARILQALMGVGTVLLTHRLARRSAGSAAARVAAVVTALYWPLVFYEGELLLTGLATFLGVAALVGLQEASVRRASGPWLVAGLLLGLGAVTRPNFLAVAALLPLAFLRMPVSRRPGRRGWLALALGVLVPVSLVAVRNRLVSGDTVLIAWQGGVNFYIGNNPEADGHSAILPQAGGDWDARGADYDLAEAAAGRRLKPSEVSWYWTRRALSWIVSEPLAWARLTGRKVLYLIWAPEIPNNLAPEFWRRLSPVLALPLPGAALLFPCALAGLLSAAGRRRLTLPAFFVVSYGATVVLFFVCGRFRIPLVPALAVLGASFAVRLIRRIRREPFRVCAPGLALLGGCFLVVTLPWFWYEGDLPGRDAASLATLGNGLVKVGDLDGAERAWTLSLRVDAAYPVPGLGSRASVVRLDLARLLVARGRPDAARRHLELLVERDPAQAAVAARLLETLR